MDASSITLTVISVCGTLSSILFAFLAFRRNYKKDNKSEGKNEGVMLSDIGYIKSSIDRIENSLSRLEERYSELSTKVAKLEVSTKNAHDRISALSSKYSCNNNNNTIIGGLE